MCQNLFSEFILFADDLKIFYVLKSVVDFEILQSRIDSIQKWRIENYMKINVFRTNRISFIRKSIFSIYQSIHFYYFFGYLLIVRTDCVKDLGVMIESKLNFHIHVD
jgi:hypothetical protein